MYKRLLIPVALEHGHRGEDALRVASLLSDAGAEIFLFHVIEDIPAYARVEIPDSIFENARKEAETSLSLLAKTSGTAAKPVVVPGHPGVTIVDYAEKHGIDCIVIASHRPELADYFLGSTAARVVRHATCSVHVIR
ncbi:MAG: universal stress protein [Pseudomonadota bacterium]